MSGYCSLTPWSDVFDDGLRDVSNRIKAKPDDFGLFVEGIAVYHMVVEGFLAVTGQTLTPTPFHSTTQGFVGAAGRPLPNLGLDRVYVISGPNTCSAS